MSVWKSAKKLLDENGNVVGVQYPISVDGDSVYAKDIDAPNSDIDSFSGSILDIFDDLNSIITAKSVGNGGVNPKYFKVRLLRPVSTTGIGIGSDNLSISNIKITLKNFIGDILKIIDYSSDSTKRGVQTFFFEQTFFTELLVEFYTDDEVSINALLILKSRNVSIDAINGVISEDNSSDIPLGADATFTGDPIDTRNYGIIICSVYSDQGSAVDGLSIEFSSDKTNWYWKDEYTVDANTGKTFSVQTQARFVRIVYTNGSVAQSVFQLETILKPIYVKPSSHRIADAISGQDDAELVKSVLTGEDPTGTFINFQATNQGNFRVSLEEYGDTPSIDAFDRLRVSNPFTIFDSKQLHDKQPLFWDESIGGSATSAHAPADANVLMSVTASATDFVIRQTKQRFNYQPGKGQLILATFLADTETGVKKRVGLFDGTGANFLTPNNGIFFENDEGTLSFNIAKNGSVVETITQANWNIDKMDGSGISLITLDMDATQIIILDYEWLGVGRVRVGFVIDGIIRYCHYFNHANDSSFTSVYMSTPNLPMRYSVESDGTGAGSLKHICSTVMSEGGVEKTGILRSSENAAAFVTGYGANKYALIGIRLKSAYLDVSVIPESVQIVIGTNDAFKWELHLNPTVNGTFIYADKTNSAIQEAQGVLANTISVDGLILTSGGGAQTARGAESSLETALRIGASIAGVQDELVLVIRPFSTNLSVWATMNYRELL